MTEITESPAPDTDTPVRRRAATFGGRLAQGFKEQNWVAIVTELAIVVIGIVIGFQITSWGQGRADRVKEQTYLRQLTADLRESERILDRADSISAPSERATAKLGGAFYAMTAPSRDSILAWAVLADAITPVAPVVGTAEALVATGDLGLLRDDTLRSEVTAYLQAIRREIAVQAWIGEVWFRNSAVALGRISGGEFLSAAPTAPDDSVWLNVWFPSRQSGRVPFPFDAMAFLSNQTVERAVFGMTINKSNLLESRNRMRMAGATLRGRIEDGRDE